MHHKFKKIVVATKNAGKLREIKHILKEFNWEIKSLKDFPEIGEIEETGFSFYENSLIKAQTVHDITKLPTLADDSGLCVEFLDGMPGIFSARFSGEECDDLKNNEKLLKLMEGLPFEERKAYFKCAMVFVCDDISLGANGKLHGYIANGQRGENGFGYDSLFYLPEYNMTTAEMASEEKNKISHRYKALIELKRVLAEKL